MATLWQFSETGTQLAVRPLAAADFEALFEAASDPLIWEQHPEKTRFQRDVFRRYFDSGLASGGALVVLDAKTHAVIGSSRFTLHDEARRSVEIGYTFLTRPYWGGAANRELKGLMLRHAFRQVDTVWFVVGEANVRSRRAVEKLGARADHRVGADVFYRLDASTFRALS